MDLNEFLSNIPTTTRDRKSAVKKALKTKSVYISIITKNNKKHFKMYFYNNNTLKTKQLKMNDVSKKYILENKNIAAFSDKAKNYLNI